ncbi:MAG: hypothetical protein ACLVL7_12220 [Anaerotruncus massiliensis (ex Togo et al. 2019)]
MDKATASVRPVQLVMYEAVTSTPWRGEAGGGGRKSLYRHFAEHPQELPDEYQAIYEREDAARAACDYISGMSDRYAVATYERLFVPRPWEIY